MRARGELVERVGGRVEEAVLQQQVLGRVAGQRQLGEHDELGAGVAGALGPVGDLGRVAVEVADGGVRLRERDAKGMAGERHPSSIATRKAGPSAGARLAARRATRRRRSRA